LTGSGIFVLVWELLIIHDVVERVVVAFVAVGAITADAKGNYPIHAILNTTLAMVVSAALVSVPAVVNAPVTPDSRKETHVCQLEFM
jgi:hypothetical protein